MRALDVCAGAGLMSSGLVAAGFSTVGVEIDRDAVASHRLNVGPCRQANLETYHPRGRFDLVAGGVPCQPFSSQGKRLGLYDPRGSLFVDLVRVAHEASARAILLENVRGLVSWEKGRALGDIFDVMQLCGFEHVFGRVLDAADFGVPQHRQRVFVIGFRDAADAERFAWPVPTHGPGRSLPFVTVRQALALHEVPGKGERLAQGWQGVRAIDVDAPSYTIGTKGNADLLVRSSLDRPSPTITGGVWHQRDRDRPSRRPLAELAAALDTAGILDRPSTTISAGAGGRVAVAGHHVRQWRGCVRLSAEQCAILQDARGWTFVGKRGSQHKQIGNGVPPTLARVVGSAIFKALDRKVA